MARYLVLGLLLVGICKISAMDEQMQKFAAMLHSVCTKETDVREELIKKANLGIFEEDPALKCYMKCLMMTATLMDEEGRINVEAVIDLVPEPLRKHFRPIAEMCEAVSGVDLCDYAFQANKCVQKNGPMYYYLA